MGLRSDHTAGDGIYIVVFDDATYFVKNATFCKYLDNKYVSVNTADWTHLCPADNGPIIHGSCVHDSFAFESLSEAQEHAINMAAQMVRKKTDNYADRQYSAMERHLVAHEAYLATKRKPIFRERERVWFYWSPANKLICGEINDIVYDTDNKTINGYNVRFFRSELEPQVSRPGFVYQYFECGLYSTKEAAAEYAAQQLKKRLLEDKEAK